MWTLAFDTTTDFCSVILLKDNVTQRIFSAEMTFGQSEVLIPEIENTLKQSGICANDLDLLVVCTGPGSFTGVRSSISAARAFGLALPHLTLCGVSAFDAYAYDLKDYQREERIAVVIETKRDDFYIAYYDQNLNRIDKPRAAFYDEIIKDLKGHPVTFAGNGAERFLLRPSGLHVHDASFQTHPSVEQLALIGINRFVAKKADFPKPLYLKAADVCVK